ncbi:hypothetical protein [Sphingomonas nostoxanthinifaciens]|uniref:hypothetical protein n=1 Tax=Sphingomonas nostoxanthinifaciens TaxID=2872652 RepID=UPI001CC1E6EC|nr:hypothetical protein [Sphingomonas nostoxanthinifaciens]UAK24370.1 hypothetical protein K8P63_18990 [Sphingomonas nostoxanthinifaciens]
MTLIDKLMQLATVWATATGRSTSRLATVVANDGKLFDRLAAGATCTVATLERFTVHLSNEVNWPNCTIPSEARALLIGLGEADSRQEAA